VKYVNSQHKSCISRTKTCFWPDEANPKKGVQKVGNSKNDDKNLVLPYVERLENTRLKAKDRTLVDIIGTRLHDIISPLLQRFTHAKILLTPQEMQVASLVKDGKTSKEIADVLNVSETTINFHRKNLRVKFSLTNQRTNLRSYLLSIS
jgi:DNA-binding CsgD family transcriptional regulator